MVGSDQEQDKRHERGRGGSASLELEPTRIISNNTPSKKKKNSKNTIFQGISNNTA